MSVKYWWMVLALFVAALAVKWLMIQGEPEPKTAHVNQAKSFEPCLPRVTLSQEQFLADDASKIRQAAAALKNAENIQKNDVFRAR